MEEPRCVALCSGADVSQSILLFWLHFGARVSPAFSHWWGTAFGSGFIFIVQDSLWLFIAIWFSRVEAIRDFLEPAGLQKGVSLVGWFAAWVAIAIAFIDGYGASKGWTASTRQANPVGNYMLGPAWCYFTLSSVLIAPFCEEVVTRGFLYRAFRGRYNLSMSVTIIICFSAYFHWSSVSKSVFTFGCLTSLWVLLCIVRERTGSLWNCLLCHAVYNSVGIHLWIPTVIVLIVFLPFVVYPILGNRRVATMNAHNRDV